MASRSRLAISFFRDRRFALKGTLLNLLILSLFSGELLLALGTALNSPNRIWTAAIYAPGLLALLLAYGLLRLKYVPAASLMTLAAIWALTSGLTLVTGGLLSPTIVGYMFLPPLGGLLLGGGGAVLATAISLLSIGGLYALDQWAVLPAAWPVKMVYDVPSVFLAQYAALILLLYLMARIVEDSVQHAQRNISDLEAVISSKGYVDSILQSMNNLLIVLDQGGKIQTVNQATVDKLGYTASELIGKSFNEIILGREEDEIASATLLIRSKTTRKLDQFLRAKDGHLLPVLLSSAVMYHERGYALGVVCVAQDVTALKRAEEQMRFQADLLENVSDAIIATRMDLTITTWNRAAEEVYGWSAEEAIGKKLAYLIYPEDADENELIKSQYMERGYWRSEVVHQRRDQQKLNILCSITLLKDNQRKPVGLALVNHDITERKRVENLLKKYIEQLATLRQIEIEANKSLEIRQVISVALDAAMRRSRADYGFMFFTTDDANIQHYAAYSSGAGRIEFRESHRPYGVVERVMQTGVPELLYDPQADPDYVVDRPTAQALMVIPLISRQRVMGVLYVEADDTERFNADIFDFMQIMISRIATTLDNARLYTVLQAQLDELNTAHTQVSNLERIKTDMIRVASHDLRNPANLANQYLELLGAELGSSATENPVITEALATIEKSIRRIQRIINDILSLERIEHIAQQSFTEVVDLTSLARTVAFAHIEEVEQKRQRLDLDLPAGVFGVRGDTAQLYEVIANLLTNAIKYTPAGGAITVNLTAHQGRALLAVTDTGYGIPEADQENLFHPFFRVKDVNTRGIEGTGLGLHLVKNIVERHGGLIRFSSVYGQGSTFGFEMPLIDNG